jgi:hypothetical protein
VRQRTIVAWISQDGHPRADVTAATYIAPPPKRLPPQQDFE